MMDCSKNYFQDFPWFGGQLHVHDNLIPKIKDFHTNYEGNAENGLATGFGTFYMQVEHAALLDNRHVFIQAGYTGEFLEGRLHGEGKLMIVRNEKKSFEIKGKFVFGFMHGPCCLVSENYQCNVVYNMGEITYPKIKDFKVDWKLDFGHYVGMVDDYGIFDGEGVLKCNDDTELHGTWKDGIFNSGTFYKNGIKYTAEWLHGRMSTNSVTIENASGVYVGNCVNFERSGIGKMVYNTGISYQGNWLNNLQHGIGELEMESGAKVKGAWEKGLRHGEFIIPVVTNSGGKFVTLFYEHGKISGNTTVSFKVEDQIFQSKLECFQFHPDSFLSLMLKSGFSDSKLSGVDPIELEVNLVTFPFILSYFEVGLECLELDKSYLNFIPELFTAADYHNLPGLCKALGCECCIVCNDYFLVSNPVGCGNINSHHVSAASHKFALEKPVSYNIQGFWGKGDLEVFISPQEKNGYGIWHNGRPKMYIERTKMNRYVFSFPDDKKYTAKVNSSKQIDFGNNNIWNR